MPQGRIVAATATGDHPTITERRKVFTALSAMHDQGLVSRCPGGWIATAKGAQALWEGSYVG